MKRVLLLMLCLFLLCSCQVPESGGTKQEETIPVAPSEAEPPMDTAPLPPPTVKPPTEPRFADVVYNSAVPRDFIYNPDDGCYYISLRGDFYQTEMWAGLGYPWDPPEIERFCKIDAKTQEITVLSDDWAGNLVYYEGYVYFYSEGNDGKIMRIRDGVIEEVFVFYDHFSRDDISWYGNFFLEDGYLYLIFRWSYTSVRVFDLETLAELPSMRYDIYADAIQICGGTIFSFSEDGLQWKKGASALQNDVTPADLIRQYYGTEEFPWIDSFLYDEVLLVLASQDLFLIRPETGALELIAQRVYRYTMHDGVLYYCSGDTLYTYDLATKETALVISYDEGIGGRADDYYGFENLAGVKFLNDRCFLYMTGMRSYSRDRVAELDLNNGTAVYLTDWFRPRVNRMTSYALGEFSYEYPNSYSVFNDSGSGGGVLINQYEKRIRININPIRFIRDERAIEDTEHASKLLTHQGLTLYYVYGGEGDYPLSALITDGETTINITVSGDPAVIKENEAELLSILQSIHIHPRQN